MPNKDKKVMAHELLQMYRHRTGLTQTELAIEIDRSSKRMVQYWEAGTSLPKPDSLRRLLALFAARKVFHPGQEKQEAARLWTAIKEAADTRLDFLNPYPVFDEDWFEDLLAGNTALPSKLNFFEQTERRSIPATKRAAGASEKRPLNNLPVQLTSFIGREQEIATLKGLLEDSSLVTLTGAGGSGKTRLALELAGELRGSFEAGVWQVELAPLVDPEVLPQVVATILGLREKTGQSLVNTLVEHLKDKRLLLVLDNCEHLLQACTSLAATLLLKCPGLHILATSREALKIAGEVEWIVPALSVPSQEVINRGLNEATLSKYEATRLFLSRAVAIRPDFTPTGENSTRLAQICARLDGIPLALELAAARVKVLSLEQINARLGERFKLLTGGGREIVPHHQTLKAMIDWSYKLLGEQEQKLLSRLSLFSGSFNLETVEQVCQGLGLAQDELLDLVASLVNKSLVLAEQKEGEIRYRLLETIQEYAHLKLAESGETPQFEQQLNRYFLDLAAELDVRAREGDFTALKKIDREYDNMRAMLDWIIQAGEAEKAVELCMWLGNYWDLKGYYQEGQRFLERSLALPGGKPTPLRAWAFSLRGTQLFTMGKNEAALSCMEQGGAIARQSNYRPAILNNLTFLGLMNNSWTEFKQAIAYLQEAQVLARELQDKAALNFILNILSQVYAYKGDYFKARAYGQEALDLSKELGDSIKINFSLSMLGIAACYSGVYQEAESYLGEAIEFNRAAGHSLMLHNTLEPLARVAIYQGKFEVGAAYLAEAVELSRSSGNRRGMMSDNSSLGLLAARQGQFDTARHHLREAIAIGQEVKSIHIQLLSLGILGWIALKEGDLEEAGHLLRESVELCRQVDSRGEVVEVLAVLVGVWHGLGFGKAETVRLAGGVEKVQLDTGHRMQPANHQVYEEALDHLRASLLPSEYEAAWKQGLQMDWEEITSFALKNKGLT